MSDVNITTDGSIDQITIDGDVVYPANRTVEFAIAPTASAVDYTLEVKHEPERVTDVSNMNAEDADAITQLSNGNWEISGATGGTGSEGQPFGDTFQWTRNVQGTGIVSFSSPAAESEYEVYIDGTAVDPSLLGGGSGNEDGPVDVEFVVASDSSAGVSYTAHVEDEPEPVMDGTAMAAESSDSVTQNDDGTWLIQGSTGSSDGNVYGDTFAWTHEGDGNGILGWDADVSASEYSLEINGSEVDPSTLPALDGDYGDGGYGDGAFGGGNGYSGTVAPDDEAVIATVSSASGLSSALSNATAGDIVYVDGDIDVGTSHFVIKQGVTLASGRGTDAGAATISSSSPNVFDAKSDARITGLRLAGPYAADGAGDYGRAIDVVGTGVEVDNCEIAEFGESGIYVSGGSVHFHHCYSRDTNMGGLGYGINVGPNGSATVERNYFHNHRHCVAANGDCEGYVFRYNHVGPTQYGVPIDMHSPPDAPNPAGVSSEVHHNVVEWWEPTKESGGIESVQIRAVPVENYTVRDNWFYNPNPPSGCSSWCDDAIIQPSIEGFDRVYFNGQGGRDPDTNHYGADALGDVTDVIPDHPGTTPW